MRFRLVLTLALAVIASGCYHHRLLTYGQAGNLQQFYRTVNTGWAGRGSTAPPAGVQASESCNNQIDRNGMHMVTMSSNLGYAALSVGTLGAVALAKVRWNCAPNPPVIGPTPSGGGRSAPTPSLLAPAGFTSRTLTSSFWGLFQSDAKAPDNPPPGGARPPGPLTPANCMDHGIRQALIPMSPLNYLYSLLTVGTAGFVSPMHVAWQCEGGPDGSR